MRTPGMAEAGDVVYHGHKTDDGDAISLLRR
jgi:hypothetical protein